MYREILTKEERDGNVQGFGAGGEYETFKKDDESRTFPLSDADQFAKENPVKDTHESLRSQCDAFSGGVLPLYSGKREGKTLITGGHPEFHKLIVQMKDIHDRKNADYGNGKQLGNFMECVEFGVDAFRGVLVRLSDKYSRIKSLANRDNMEGEVKDESIEDTLLDLANYALLAIVIRRETNEKNNSC